MIKKYFILLVVIAFLFVEYRYGITDSGNPGDDRLPVKILPFRTAAGWGYEIDVDGKPFIHQDYIPAIQGKKSFQSPEDAVKVGELVLEKMKNKKRPVVTVDELKKMSIKEL